MKRNSLYSISFGGLSLGEHNFDFVLTNDFFASFGESEILNGDCKVSIDMKKHSSFLEMNVDIVGTVAVECDRCLEEVQLTVDFQSLLIVKLSSEVGDPEFEINTEEEDIIWVNSNDNQLDMSQYLFDSISLSLPISRIHPDDENGESTCNKDMLDRFIQSK